MSKLRKDDCPFCLNQKRGYTKIVIGGNEVNNCVLYEANDFFVFRDPFPVVKDHMLIVTRAHIPDCLMIRPLAWLELPDIIRKIMRMLKEFDPSIVGYNLGLNSGKSAGQTVMHCHFHLFPRRKGDVENPRGGIRNFKTPIMKY